MPSARTDRQQLNRLELDSPLNSTHTTQKEALKSLPAAAPDPSPQGGDIISVQGAAIDRNRGAGLSRNEGRHHFGFRGRLPSESSVRNRLKQERSPGNAPKTQLETQWHGFESQIKAFGQTDREGFSCTARRRLAFIWPSLCCWPWPELSRPRRTPPGDGQARSLPLATAPAAQYPPAGARACGPVSPAS